MRKPRGACNTPYPMFNPPRKSMADQPLLSSISFHTVQLDRNGIEVQGWLRWREFRESAFRSLHSVIQQ